MEYFRGLLSSKARIEKFQSIISETVGPGDVVLEVGTGLGTFAMFAARAGADHVYAVDGDPVVHVAKTIAKINDFDGRIEFIRGWIPDVELDRRANVLIFEDYPVRFLDHKTHTMLAEVARRYLTPDARMIPSRGRVWIAPVSAAAAWKQCAPLSGDEDVAFGMDWSPSLDYVRNATLSKRIPPGALVGKPRVLYDVPLLPLPDARDMSNTLSFEIDQPATIHGIAYWFDLGFSGESWYSNSPKSLDSPWGQIMLPLDRPVSVEKGQIVEISVRTERRPSGAPGWLNWSFATGDALIKGHELKGFPMSKGDLRRASLQSVPVLSQNGKYVREVLEMTDGRLSLDEIVAKLVESHGLDNERAVRIVTDSLSGMVQGD